MLIGISVFPGFALISRSFGGGQNNLRLLTSIIKELIKTFLACREDLE